MVNIIGVTQSTHLGANSSEFVVPHSCIKCVCFAPDGRMVEIANTN